MAIISEWVLLAKDCQQNNPDSRILAFLFLFVDSRKSSSVLENKALFDL